MSCIAACPTGTYADRTDPNNSTCKVILKKKFKLI